MTFVNMDEDFDLFLSSTSYNSSNDNDIFYDGFYWNNGNTFDPDRFLGLNQANTNQFR